jgi:guanylate kinase
MDKKYQVIALIGMAGAGKDTMQKATCKAHPLMFNPIISCTTRPMREAETPGVDYHFISIEDFTRKVLNGNMLEATEFRNWFYGTPINSLAYDKINIGVFNPAGVEALVDDPRLNVLVVKINCDDKTRLLRCLNRETHPDCDEICRRYMADKEDFAKLELDEYAVVESKDGSCEDLLECQGFNPVWLEEMWSELDTSTEFETIVRWESSMLKKAEPADIEVKED